jgi:hypothetical protein
MRAKRADQPIPEKHFAALANITPRQDGLDLRGFLNSRTRTTTEELHLYADGANGNDANDGLSASAPKKTLQAVLDMVPEFVQHNTMIHLAGDFVLAEDAYKTVVVAPSQAFVLSGEYGDWTDTGEGILTTTAGDKTALDVSGAGWTTDEHAGYYIEILTGDAAGEIRQVFSNDSDTLVPSKDFSVDPRGSGEATFRIVKQRTTIDGKVHLNVMSSGRIKVQHLRFTAGSFCYMGGDGDCSISSTMFEDLPSNTTWFIRCAVLNIVGWGYWDDFSTNYSGGGVAFLGTKTLAINDCVSVGLQGSYFSVAVQVFGSNYISAAFGSRFTAGIELHGMLNQFIPHLRGSAAGYRDGSISNASGPGVLVSNGYVQVQAGMDISNCSTWGIEAYDSTVVLVGVVTGSGNTTGGLYAYAGSKVLTTSGSAPTLTGGSTIELSFDGSTQQATCATVDSTPQVEVTTDILLAKAV